MGGACPALACRCAAAESARRDPGVLATDRMVAAHQLERNSRAAGWGIATAVAGIALAGITARLAKVADRVVADLSLGLYWDVLAAPVLWPYLLAWAALAVWLQTVQSRWSAGRLATLTLLLGIGLATLLQLGVGATETRWTRYGGGNAALASAFGWLVWAGLEFWWGWRPHPAIAEKLARWGLQGLGVTALLLLVMQAIFGD